VGIKPSKGLVSTRGVLPAAQSVDCVSIFARTVDVAAKVLAVLATYDAQDP
jgi:allophanate hydrolase